MKELVLITNPRDLDFVKANFAGSTYQKVAHEHFLIQLFPQENLPYFFGPSDMTATDQEQIQFLSSNWHRDQTGRDKLCYDGISPGLLINRRVVSTFANIYKNYHALKEALKSADVVHASVNESPSFLRAAKVFGDKVKFYDPGHREHFFETSTPERTIISDYPPVHRLSKPLRLIQKLFSPLITKKKILYFTDWTSLKAARKTKGLLLFNDRLPWRGAYCGTYQNYLAEAEVVFPVKIDADFFSIRYLSQVLARAFPVWDEALVQLFGEVLCEQYHANRHIFIRAYAIYKELFTHYKPKLVIVPGETFFAYQIAAQVAHRLNIKVMQLVDGYYLIPEKTLLYRDQTGHDTVYDYYAAFGQASVDFLTRLGLKPKKCILMRAPYLDLHTFSAGVPKTIDALIMAPNCNQLNPQSRWDYRFVAIIEMLEAAFEAGLARVALKIKPDGDPLREKRTIAFYEDMLDKKGLKKRVPILTGEFYNYLPKTKVVIGTLSAAVIETAYHGIPFFIYEPPELGHSDQTINDSCIYSLESIARTPAQLKEIIKSGRSSITADFDYLFSGKNFNEIALLGEQL